MDHVRSGALLNHMISHELARQLKEAGFPQIGVSHDFEKDGRIESLRTPSAEQLIEWCGEEFVAVRNFKREVFRTSQNEKQAQAAIKEFWDGLPHGEWIADSSRVVSSDEGTISYMTGEGHNIKEAVARLGIKLHEHRKK